MRIDLSSRQKQILAYLNKIHSASVQEILDYLNNKNLADVSRPTINRDIDELLQIEFVNKEGSGPATKYSITSKAKLLTLIDTREYFSKEPDQRNAYTSFNWQIFDLLNSTEIFSDEEEDTLSKLQSEYRGQKANLSNTIIQKEIERVTIELSWKSSKIEGNTYSLLETENLLKTGQPAKGRSQFETQMILNHKTAIDIIFSNPQEFKLLSLAKIEEIHKILTKELNIQAGIRKTLVGITGTSYQPLDNTHQIQEAIEKTLEIINKTDDVFTKSLIAMLMLSYIQPFEDGNKRTSRILGNAILLAYDTFPLSFRNVDEVRYKEAVLLFYEQNNMHAFKEIFINQCKFSVGNYFRSGS